MLSRYNYEQKIQTLADTMLYEEALKTIKETERAKDERNSGSIYHVFNSLIYSEFWRRNKAHIYYMAHNQCMRMIGKFNRQGKEDGIALKY